MKQVGRLLACCALLLITCLLTAVTASNHSHKWAIHISWGVVVSFGYIRAPETVFQIQQAHFFLESLLTPSDLADLS